MAPGSRWLAFASRWFDERTVASVFEPLIADYQREWRDEGSSRRVLISIRAMVAFAVAVRIVNGTVRWLLSSARTRAGR